MIYIGRFQPFHLGHHNTVIEAFKKTDNLILVIGSTNKARDIKNPFTYKERVQMVHLSLADYLSDNPTKRLHFVAIEDHPYSNNMWLSEVQTKVKSIHDKFELDYNNSNHALTGFVKDASSFYLKYFPQWKQEHVKYVLDEFNRGIDGTYIREQLFGEKKMTPYILPEGMWDWLFNFTLTETYEQLCYEYEFIKKYKSAWDCAPYPPVFVTVDAVVVAAGHLLVVKRGACPGKGLFALPGGFLDQNEQIEDGMVRELYEETQLKVPRPVLSGSIRSVKVFDAPERSLRGRTITHAHYLQLKDEGLPKVKGGVSDDADMQYWMPLNEVYENRSKFFEDHFSIISAFSILPKN